MASVWLEILCNNSVQTCVVAAADMCIIILTEILLLCGFHDLFEDINVDRKI